MATVFLSRDSYELLHSSCTSTCFGSLKLLKCVSSWVVFFNQREFHYRFWAELSLFPYSKGALTKSSFLQNFAFFLTYLTSWNSVFLLECPKGWANSSSQKLWITMDGWNWYWIHTWLVAEKCISFCFFIQFELLYSSKGSLWREEVSCITCRYLCYLLIPHNEQ